MTVCQRDLSVWSLSGHTPKVMRYYLLTNDWSGERFSKSKSLVCGEFSSLFVSWMKLTLASKGPQWRVVTLFWSTAGLLGRSCWTNVRLSFGLKVWILWLKTTQLKLEITFLAIKTCFKRWWVILSCKTFGLVWQPSASRLICINFPYSIALTACFGVRMVFDFQS